MIAHVGGLPVEETIVQLAPTGIGVLLLVRLGSERIRRFAARAFEPVYRRRDALEVGASDVPVSPRDSGSRERGRAGRAGAPRVRRA